MIITVLGVGGRVPSGGQRGAFEYANGLARRGHKVHVVHTPTDLGPDSLHPKSVEEISWMTFEPEVQHHFPETYDESTVPPCDFIVTFDGRVLDIDSKQLNLVTGLGVFGEELEGPLLAAPSPKLCISTHLQKALVDMGIRPKQVVYVPYGLDHSHYRVITPIADRGMVVTFEFRRERLKGSWDAVRCLNHIKKEFPELQVHAFSKWKRPENGMPDWFEFTRLPSPDFLVERIYNSSRIFVNPSLTEGFCLVAAEAMACGNALITTDCGGPADYATHGETALVYEPGNLKELAHHLRSLLTNDPARRDLATRGVEAIRQFDWDRSAAILEKFLQDYAADPAGYQNPEDSFIWSLPAIDYTKIPVA